MAVRSLRSMVRMEGTFSSSPGLYGSSLSHVHGSPMALSGFVGIHSRVISNPSFWLLHAYLNPIRGKCTFSQTTGQIVRPRGGYSQGTLVQGRSLGTAAGKGARRLHVLRDAITENADGAFTALTVVFSSAFAGVWYWMKHTDTSDPSRNINVALMGPQDPAMKTTDAYYLRRKQANLDVKRARESYNEEEAVVEDMDNDPQVRARFEDWIKKYGRAYKDEAEKARRFKIFKAVAKAVDMANADAAKSGSNVQYGLTEFADRNSQEIISRRGTYSNRG